jgi:hypothetical protein
VAAEDLLQRRRVDLQRVLVDQLAQQDPIFGLQTI